MTQDTISARDIVRSLPGVIRRFPAIARGLYYYSVKGDRKNLTLGTLIERNADKYGDRTAVLYEDRLLTYREFNHWANRIAHYLQDQGLVKGDAIAVMLENRPELLAIVAGAAKVGVACALMNTAQKGDALTHSINLIRPRMMVVGEECLVPFDGIRRSLPADAPDHCLYLADENTLSSFGETPEGYVNLAERVSAYPGDNPVLGDAPKLGDTAVYLFTSGTTGLPKAAPGSHRKFIKAYGGFGLMSLNMEPTDVLYCTLPFYHGTALLVCWGSVLAGGSAIAIRRRFSASEFWDDVRRFQATTFGYVGELCRYLLNQPPSDRDRDHSLSKMIGNGLRPSIWTPFKQRFGINTVAELYASSEGNIGFSNFLNLDNTVGFSTAPYKLVQFYDGTRDPVRDRKGRLKAVGKGDPGLLIGEITAKWSFEGYTQREATEQSIIRHAFKKGDQWFNTGDVLREIGCGHLQFVDRMGDTFRWKGENVSTHEVENILDESGLVEEAICYGVDVPAASGKAGMVTLVPHPVSNGIDPDELFRYLEGNLPSYAIPVFIRVTDRIEKTGTFKYRKTDLQKAGFRPGPGNDAVYAWLPRTRGYTRIDQALNDRIENGGIPF